MDAVGPSLESDRIMQEAHKYGYHMQCWMRVDNLTKLLLEVKHRNEQTNEKER